MVRAPDPDIVDAGLVSCQYRGRPCRHLRAPDPDCLVVAAGDENLHVPDNLVVEAPHSPAEFEHVGVELSRYVTDQYGRRGVAADRDDCLVAGKILDALDSIPEERGYSPLREKHFLHPLPHP